MSFEQLGLSKPLTDALAAKNYTQPTPIQTQAIPTVLTGRDLLGIAQTGTGKTAAFMLPSLQRLHAAKRVPRPGQIRMLVLAPTRELASQIAASAEAYGKGLRASVGVIFGGVANQKSLRTVQRGLDVLVATPGRLLDLVDQRAVNLSELEILVLDEADQMLDLGFIHALKRIVKIIPVKRQTLFFSATMPKTIKQLADTYLSNPAEVSVAPVATTAERVEQQVTFVNQAEKTALLTLFFQTQQIDRSLVFSRTKHGADKVVRQLAAAGIAANAIHGNKSQPQREKALAAFRDGSVPILVATDIAARGIDIPGVSHVINFDLPNVPEQYVHRIGRTARAGADGIAIAYCADDEKAYLRDIEKLTRQKITPAPLPAGFNQAVEALKRLKPEPKRAPQPARNNTKLRQGRGRDADPRRDQLPRHDPRSDMPRGDERVHGQAQPRHPRPAKAHPNAYGRPQQGGDGRTVANPARTSAVADRPSGQGRPAQGGRPSGAGRGRGRPSGQRSAH
jgi:ATP-dependent RNA helicase RhlE